MSNSRIEIESIKVFKRYVLSFCPWTVENHLTHCFVLKQIQMSSGVECKVSMKSYLENRNVDEILDLGVLFEVVTPDPCGATHLASSDFQRPQRCLRKHTKPTVPTNRVVGENLLEVWRDSSADVGRTPTPQGWVQGWPTMATPAVTIPASHVSGEASVGGSAMRRDLQTGREAVLTNPSLPRPQAASPPIFPWTSRPRLPQLCPLQSPKPTSNSQVSYFKC